MKKIFRKLLGGVLLFSLSMSLTSCEGALDDILGEWSRPVQIKECPISFSISSKLWGSKDSKFTVEVTKNGDYTVTFSSSDPSIATVDPNTGEVTPVGAGTVDIIAKIVVDNEGIFESTTAKYTLTIEEGNQYMKWNETTKQMEIAFIDATAMPAESTLADGPASSKLLPTGTYIIAEDMTFANTIRLSGDVNIILCDGTTLTMNGSFYGYDGTDYYKLNIYGQSDNSGKLIIKNCMGAFKPLNIYGGQIDATASWGGAGVIGDVRGMNVYGGKVNAVNTSSSGGSGIMLSTADTYTLTIYGGEVFAKGPATEDNQSGFGIGGSANVVVNGGSLVAISQRNNLNSAGIYGNLTVNGGSVEVKDVNKTTGEISGDSRAAVSGTITVGAGVSLQGKNHDTDWADITDNTNAYKHIRTKQ